MAQAKANANKYKREFKYEGRWPLPENLQNSHMDDEDYSPAGERGRFYPANGDVDEN